VGLQPYRDCKVVLVYFTQDGFLLLAYMLFNSLSAGVGRSFCLLLFFWPHGLVFLHTMIPGQDPSIHCCYIGKILLS
jgi:hypothetical protein